MTKQAVFNPTTRKFDQKEVEGNSNPGNGEHTVWYGVTGEELKRFTQYAREDGFDLNGESVTGSKAKVGKAVKQYIGIAIREFMASRDKLAQQAAKTPPAPVKNALKS